MRYLFTLKLRFIACCLFPIWCIGNIIAMLAMCRSDMADVCGIIPDLEPTGTVRHVNSCIYFFFLRFHSILFCKTQLQNSISRSTYSIRSRQY